VSYLLELVDEADKNKDGKIDFDEFGFMGMSSTFLRKRCFFDGE
jgi:Ca2+-binding EF-hand superfamily protein